MSRREWSTMAPPVVEVPPVVASTMERPSGTGHRVTYLDVHGEPLFSAWAPCAVTARALAKLWATPKGRAS